MLKINTQVFVWTLLILASVVGFGFMATINAILWTALAFVLSAVFVATIFILSALIEEIREKKVSIFKTAKRYIGELVK